VGRVVAIGYSRAVSDFDYDQLVIGSGFGGSVAALRLAERMMGVVPNAIITDTDRLAEEIAKAWDAARPLPQAPWVFSSAMAPRTTNPSRIPTFTERAPRALPATAAVAAT
jgi:choline dehydrogenase-like flavoprotein